MGPADGGDGVERAQWRLDCRLGAGHGEERTANMLDMVVTWEVLKLSGWLNAFAFCRESKGGHIRCGAGFGPGGGRRWATVGHAVCGGGLDCRLGAGHGEERTVNIWSMFVTLEVSKLSGWLNAFAFCRESKGGHAMRDEVRPGRGAGVRRQRRTQRAGEGATADWGQGTGRSALGACFSWL